MIMHGDQAHSLYFGEDAFDNMTGTKHEKGKSTQVGNKELLIIPGATHCDLYDGGEGHYIPFDKLEAFFRANLK